MTVVICCRQPMSSVLVLSSSPMPCGSHVTGRSIVLVTLSVVLTVGQRHHSTQLEAVLDGIRVPRPGGCGRPRQRPAHLIADKGYSYERCRQELRRFSGFY